MSSHGYAPAKAIAMLCGLLSSTGVLAAEFADSQHAGSNGPPGGWFDLPLPGPATDQVIDISYRSRAAGDRTWGRLAGTRWAEMTVDYVIGQLQRAGIQNIKRIDVPFRGPEQLATDWHLKLLAAPEFGSGSQDVELPSAFPMAQTAEGAVGQATGGELPPVANLAISASVIYLGAGTLADLAGKDFRGKIAVLRIEPAPSLFYSPEFVLKQVLADAAVRNQFTAPARFVGAPVAELAPIVAAGATGIQDVETSIWYHTSGDTPATVSAESMQRVLLFYQDVLNRLDRLSRAQIRGSQ
jgi:hypothetical protein